MPEFGHEDPFSGAGPIQGGFDNIEPEVAAVRNSLLTIPSYPNRIFAPAPAPAIRTWQSPEPRGLVGFFAPQTSRRNQTEDTKLQIERQRSMAVQTLTRNLDIQRALLQQIESGRQNLTALAQRAEAVFNVINLRRSAKLEYERKAVEQLRRNHLAGRRLKVGDVSNIGAVRVSQLNGHGIFTAADISSRAIMQLPGFGPASVSGLLAWQASVERSFRQKPIPYDQGQIDLLAKELLRSEKARFEKDQREFKTSIDAIVSKATFAAGEAAKFQQEIDQANVNLLAIDHFLKKLD